MFSESGDSLFINKIHKQIIDSHLCNDEIGNYYLRRAKSGIGLIITEGIVIHPGGNGYNTVPFIHTNSQAESWRDSINKV
jgi:2,4-dienoyl-CoA reductase-like NADH-dependent reductase (Old Yellow Enzyme family)